MSWAYTTVEYYGERVSMRCEDCGITERYALIKQAQAAARVHNRSLHGRDTIKTTQPKHRSADPS